METALEGKQDTLNYISENTKTNTLMFSDVATVKYGAYEVATKNDLANTEEIEKEISEIAITVDSLKEKSGDYLTATALEGYATQTYVDTAVANASGSSGSGTSLNYYTEDTTAVTATIGKAPAGVIKVDGDDGTVAITGYQGVSIQGATAITGNTAVSGDLTATGDITATGDLTATGSVSIGKSIDSGGTGYNYVNITAGERAYTQRGGEATASGNNMGATLKGGDTCTYNTSEGATASTLASYAKTSDVETALKGKQDTLNFITEEETSITIGIGNKTAKSIELGAGTPVYIENDLVATQIYVDGAVATASLATSEALTTLATAVATLQDTVDNLDTSGTGSSGETADTSELSAQVSSLSDTISAMATYLGIDLEMIQEIDTVEAMEIYNLLKDCADEAQSIGAVRLKAGSDSGTYIAYVDGTAYELEAGEELVVACNTSFGTYNAGSTFKEIDTLGFTIGCYSSASASATSRSNTIAEYVKIFCLQKGGISYPTGYELFRYWGGAPTETKLYMAKYFTSLANAYYGASAQVVNNTIGAITDTSKVTTLAGTFNSCSSLTSVDLSSWDISSISVTEGLSNIFYKCTSLTSVDLSGWCLSHAAKMEYTFSYCSSLTSLDVSGCDFTKVTSTNGIFSGCSALVNIVGDFTWTPSANLPLGASSNLSYESMINVLNALPTVTTSRTVTFNPTAYALLSDDDKAIGTAKGWTVASGTTS